jgi:hypothetical protein
VALPAFAAGPSLDGPTFSVPGIAVVWKAPTNSIPAKLWVYKVVPQDFSPTAISNLMALGPFSSNDRTHIEGQPLFKDKRLMYFANGERTRYLGIFPPFGWSYFKDERAIGGKGDAKGLPGEDEAADLALRYLLKLGFDRSELATKDGSSDLQVYRVAQDRRRLDKTKQEHVSEVILRGVSFVRRVDGVSLTGRGSDGGFSISFGNEGKVASLELVWRKLEKHQLKNVSPTNEMIERIKQGRAKVHPLNTVDWRNAKSLTVEKVVPFYLGADGETKQEFMYPFASIEGTIQFEDGRNVGIALKCPILADK